MYLTARRGYRRMLDLTAPVRSRLPGGCRVSVHGRNNRVSVRATRVLRQSSVTISGTGNTVTVSALARVDGLRINILGDNNIVTIGESSLVGVGIMLQGNGNTATIGDACMVRSLGIVCEDSDNCVSIGAGTQIHGSTELAALEGTTLTVGEECLFSGGIHIRTGDSHSITDMSGRRINRSEDIRISSRVWVGREVTVLKGAFINHSSVIGAAAVVTRRFETPHVAIAGNPAKVIRTEIDWRTERIPFSEENERATDGD